MSRHPELDLKAAERVWGAHPSSWPRPPRRRPRWWQFEAKRRLARLEAAFDHLSDHDLARYYDEVALGQSVYEDAGGYMLRCYRAMLGLPVEAPVSQADIIAGLLHEAAGDRHTRLAEAFAAAEKAFPNHYWMFGKGKTRPDEPLFGFALFDKHDADEPVACGEDDDPVEAVNRALANIETKGEA